MIYVKVFRWKPLGDKGLRPHIVQKRSHQGFSAYCLFD